ncbi:helix-turn-helix domain-containing protein [Actinacidiphila acididurans]|uniref:Helix-turn-helix domain-containing protein n=1 Tax=Actinacidiphila acididurans TaxID=2784346 RepID=A0ABS2U0B9_9ACTN|nr:helix-turn-helix transcriptional regulator [Actinacidiphila acididurans]MBM9509040.1 helix-turn-helix domain-containing protein [Actinacidiphila acididurans]
MAVRDQDPIFQRERLRDRLKKARDAAGLTQREVAEALEWSPSKVVRIENGSVGVSITDARVLLSHYAVTDSGQVQEILDMARSARQPPWWAPYRGVAASEFLTYLAYETSAAAVRNFQSSLVPGLLQTEDYARIVFGEVETAERAEALLNLRLERQDRLLQPDGPELTFILDEATVRREVGGKRVMENQLKRLLVVNELPNVKVMIAPFSAGIYAQFRSPYVLFEFPNSEDDMVAYLETPDGQVLFSEKAPGYKGENRPTDYLDAFIQVEKTVAVEATENFLFG